MGIRDETRILGGFGPCGRECCCAGALPEFRKVSIKMAKVQGLSLNPSKISGLCGRLMCCLSYENEYYSEAYKKMPRIGAEVSTPEGKGTVVSDNMLKMLVRVKIEKDGGLVYKDFPVADVTVRAKGAAAAEEEEERTDRPDRAEKGGRRADKQGERRRERKERPEREPRGEQGERKKNRPQENRQNRRGKPGREERPSRREGQAAPGEGAEAPSEE